MPVELNGTVTRFATVSAAVKLRLETTGIVVPWGNTVMKPGCVVLVTVMFRTAADAVAGTGTVPTPVTCTFREDAPTRVFPAYVAGSVAPVRVSVMRKGVTAT
jgi:hypothetical protein